MRLVLAAGEDDSTLDRAAGGSAEAHTAVMLLFVTASDAILYFQL